MMRLLLAVGQQSEGMAQEAQKGHPRRYLAGRKLLAREIKPGPLRIAITVGCATQMRGRRIDREIYMRSQHHDEARWESTALEAAPNFQVLSPPASSGELHHRRGQVSRPA